MGSAGDGKTTLAEVIARYANADVERISAVTSGVKKFVKRLSGRVRIVTRVDVRSCSWTKFTVLIKPTGCVLPHIEDGTIAFIGATTENPSFELNSALLSRARVYLLKSLTTDDIEQVLDQSDVR